MSDATTIDFFFDVASPYSYMASTQIEGLEARTGAYVEWRPFLLGGVFKETGNTMPAAVQAKASYMLEDLDRWADFYDVPFRMNSHFPVNSLSAQRALLVVGEDSADDQVALAHALFAAVWTEDADISKPDVLRGVFDEVGLDADDVLARIQQPPAKKALREVTAEAVERGAFGAPSFFVGDELFWGNDRLQFVERAIDG